MGTWEAFSRHDLVGAERTSRARLRLLSAALAAAGLSVLLQWPALDRAPLLAVVTPAASATLVALGVLLGEDPEQRGTARAFALAGVLWPVARVAGWEGVSPELLAAVAATATALVWFLLAWAMLRYPYARLPGVPAWAFLAVLVAWLLVVAHAFLWTSAPLPATLNSSDRWPVLYPYVAASPAVSTVLGWGDAVLGMAFMGLVMVRIARARRPERRMLLPAVTAAAVTGVLAGLGSVLGFTSSAPHAGDRTVLLQGVALLLAPMGFLLVTVRRRLVRGQVNDAMLRLGRSPTIEAVRAALRQALRDPTLDVLYQVPDERTYVDSAGHPVTPPGAATERHQIPVTTSTGQPLALILADPSLRQQGALLETAVSSSRWALENAHLQATIRAQMEQVRASRERLVEAGLAQRRQIERDLHDGAQQRLLGLAAKLGVAKATAQDADTIDAIDAARAELRQALEELRELAQGIHPSVLSQAGLGPAIEVVAERLPLPVEVDVPACRFPPEVEATAYFVACEALTNLVKHAHASRVTVSARIAGDALWLEVADDGAGGARTQRGGRLADLTDLTRAIGGELTVTSPPGRGTRLEVKIPCA